MKLISRKSRPDSDQESENFAFHTPFFPADIRPGDNVQARISYVLEGQTLNREVRVWRLSPIGVEFICDLSELVQGSVLDFEIVLNKQICFFSGMVVSSLTQSAGRRLLGIRWCEESGKPLPQLNRRVAIRWLCSDEFLPMGMAANPVRFDDFIHFRVKDLSPTGMQIITSMRNRVLVPGMTLEGVVTFPMFGQANITFQIVNSRIISTDRRTDLSLGVRFVDLDPNTLELIGQYVFQFGPATTVRELKDAGLAVHAVSQAIDYSFVRTERDYGEVLELRHKCYMAAQKTAPTSRPEDMSDRYDAHARIMIARYRGKAVGTLRIVFPDQGAPLEHEESFKIPDHFPRYDELVEVSRVCTDPDFRGHDLLMGMFRRATLAILQSKRRYVLGSSEPKLLPFYKKIGLFPVGITYQHALLNNMEHSVFLGDTRGMVLGSDLNPIVWNIMYADLLTYLTQQEILSFPNANLRLAFYRLFGLAARLYQKWQIWRSRSR